MHKHNPYVIPVASIFLASALIIFGVSLLGNTDWAHQLRVNHSPVEFRDQAEMPFVIQFIDAFLKVVLFMGIPAFLTLGILRIRNRGARLQHPTRG